MIEHQIVLQRRHQMNAWMLSLKCSEAELRAAVKAVGNSPHGVRDWLQQYRAALKHGQIPQSMHLCV
jgi:Protein of unknown function (DUF3606)